MCTITTVSTSQDFAAFGSLVREYVASLPFELDFQDLEGELAGLEHHYGPPGGTALLANMAGAAVGCVGVRPLEPPQVAEMKRMYLRPEGRGRGLGRSLAETALRAAAALGYEAVRLDTVAELVEATALYETMGFVEIEPYRHNPRPTARFYEVALREAGFG